MNCNIKIATIQNGEKLPIVENEAKLEENEREYIIKYIEAGCLVEYIYNKEENKVIINRKGLGVNRYNSIMIFENNKTHKTKITTDEYVLDIIIKTDCIKFNKEEGKITIYMEYDINEAHNIVKVEIIC